MKAAADSFDVNDIGTLQVNDSAKLERLAWHFDAATRKRVRRRIRQRDLDHVQAADGPTRQAGRARKLEIKLACVRRPSRLPEATSEARQRQIDVSSLHPR